MATKGNFKSDIGFDDLGNGLYQNIIYSEDVNTHNIAHVFGLSVEECEANSKLLSASKAMFTSLKDIQSMCDGNIQNENDIWHRANFAIKRAT